MSKHGRSKSVLETLEPFLAELCNIKTFSEKRNRYLRFLNMLLGFLTRGLRSDIIMIDVFSTTNFYFAYTLSLLSSLFNKPYILFLHGGSLPARYERSTKKVDYIFSRAKAIVAPSMYLKSFFESAGYKVVLIPNIVDIRKFPFKKRELLQPRLLYVRGFGKIYNPLMTVRTVSILRNEYPNVVLAMLGSDADGSLQETQKLIEKLRLEPNVKILGRMTQEEWVRVSSEYSIMVSNPIIDNTPVSVIEGMALGLLVISTNVGGISHFLTDNEDALLVESDDHEGMANAVRQALTNTELSGRIRENARRKAESLSWDTIRPLWAKLLTQQVSSND